MKTAVVTGASKGIGREIAMKLCERGWSVIGVARSIEQLDELRKAYPDRFQYIQLDLSRPESARLLKDRVESLGFSRVDMLVNNPGAGLYKRIIDHALDEIESLVYLNFISPLTITKALLPLMSNGSTVVFIVSAIIHIASTQLPVYGAAKIGLHYAVKILRKELEEREIHVLSVYPGYVNTDFHVSAGRGKVARGVSAEYVADKVIEAVEKRKKSIYVPSWVSIAKILGPVLPVV